MIATAKTPVIDWLGAAPLWALAGGAIVTLLLGLSGSAKIRERVVPSVAVLAFVVAGVFGAIEWGDPAELFVASGSQGALSIDKLAQIVLLFIAVSGVATVLLSVRDRAPREAEHGEYYTLLLVSATGMVVLAAAQNLVTIFLGFELLSIPLYVLCAAELRRTRSLEAGLKYLIFGSLGSATLLYGLALLYGATGETDLRGIADGVNAAPHDSLLIAGIALTVVGLAYKTSIAPFHQWTPDVYEGAPTPITNFMAIATKAAGFGVFLRLFDVALIGASDVWAPLLAGLAAISIIVGNVGAISQDSLKRMLAWSSVAQAGYMLGGVVAVSAFGVQATLFYLGGYIVMNIAAFAVVVVRERETGLGDSIASVAGIGRDRPLVAWAMTIAMLGLAGMPATVGFVGKFTLIGALVDADYTWLGVVIVVGSMISLVYYLRVVAAIWLPATREEPVAATGLPRVAGAEPAGEKAGVEATIVAVAGGAAVLGLGVIPGPLMNLVQHAGRALGVL